MTDDEDDVIAMAMREARARDEGSDDDSDESIKVGEVTSVADLVALQIALEQKLKDLEQEVKDTTAELEKVRTKDLPEKMLEMNVTSWTTQVGDRRMVVKLDRVFYPAIKKEDMPAFVRWLKKRGDEGIVKPKFVLSYEKGQVDEAEKMAALIAEMFPNAPVVYEPEVHWQTMRAYTKDVVTEIEKDETAEKLPDFYRYHETNISKITSKKV